MKGAEAIAVFLGGGLGSLCRYGISLFVMRVSASRFPIATLSSNVLSCAVMATFLIYASTRIPEGSWLRVFMLVGFCGGFSTFSTFSLENYWLMKEGQFGILGLNILLSVLLCLLIFISFGKVFKMM